MEQSVTARLFSVRLGYWTAQGYSGAEVYEQLAHDDHLPAFFDQDDIAGIEGTKPSAVKKARHRGTGAAFLRMSVKVVKYPRAEYCLHLASRFVRRGATGPSRRSTEKPPQHTTRRRRENELTTEAT